MGIKKELGTAKSEELRERLNIETRINPFAYEDHFGLWEFIKCCFGVVIVPIKFFFAGMILLMMGFFAKLSILGGLDDSKPMGCFRRFVQIPIPWLSRLFLLVFGFFWIKVKGKPSKRSAAPVWVIAPHSTFVDSFVLVYVGGLFSGIGKEEASKTPIFGTLFRAGQMIPVKRESGNGKKKALDEFVRRAQSDDPWRHLIIFPEGTCTNRKALIQFKKGAFEPGVPIQPVVLKWPYKNFDPSWTSSAPSRFKLILRLLSQVYNSCEVEFLPVYEPNEQEKEDPVLYANNLRKVMADALGVPTTEHSYEDTFLSMAAQKGKLNPNDIVNFEFTHLKNLMNMDLKEAKRLLRRFGSDPKVKKTGKMNVEQFARALKVPLTEPVYELFQLLDTNDQGFIYFKDFLIGLTFISKNTTPADGVDLLFEALDPENSGKISVESLNRVLTKVFNKVDKKLAKKIFHAADPEKTGYVDKERFKKYVTENPELLIVGLEFSKAYKERERPLSVLRKSELEERMSNQQIAPIEDIDLEKGAEE